MRTILTLLCFLLAGSAWAQAPADTSRYAADHKSVDAIVNALYDVISGPAGQKRDWDRMRALFPPEGRLIATGRNKEGKTVMRMISVEDYIKNNSARMEQDGFIEQELARRVESFGAITHVWTTYAARHKADDATPFMRGINSVELYFDGTRYWVLQVYWQPELPTLPLPKEYLRSKK